MPQRRFQGGEYYHLYNRGNARQPIFFEPENYRFFLTRLREHFTSETADIVAYCLMPNHYHLLVFLRRDDLAAVMRPLGMGYAKAVNRHYARSGHLFQGPFQAKRIETTILNTLASGTARSRGRQRCWNTLPRRRRTGLL